MLKMFNSLFGRRAPEAQTSPTSPTFIRPENAFVAVGDIHGCHDRFSSLLEKIEAQRSAHEPVIFLGDLIDRGPHSAQVLQSVFEMQTRQPQTCVALMGNHEKMMLDFIDDPAGRGERWLRYGGAQTLESYGLSIEQEHLDAEQALDLSSALEAALPSGMQDWLRALPLQWSSGNMHCVHAAMSPNRPPNRQDAQVLLWGHRDFLTKPRSDEICVIHGHTITKSPVALNGRIGIDTGAFQGNPLTAVHITDGAADFIQG